MANCLGDIQVKAPTWVWQATVVVNFGDRIEVGRQWIFASLDRGQAGVIATGIHNRITCKVAGRGVRTTRHAAIVAIKVKVISTAEVAGDGVCTSEKAEVTAHLVFRAIIAGNRVITSWNTRRRGEGVCLIRCVGCSPINHGQVIGIVNVDVRKWLAIDQRQGLRG